MTDHQRERRCTCTSSLENVAQTAPWKQKREADALLVFALKSILHAWNGNVLVGFLIYLSLDNFSLWNCKASMSLALKASALQKTKAGICLSPPPCHCCCPIHLEDALTLFRSFGCLRCQPQCQESLWCSRPPVLNLLSWFMVPPLWLQQEAPFVARGILCAQSPSRGLLARSGTVAATMCSVVAAR